MNCKSFKSFVAFAMAMWAGALGVLLFAGCRSGDGRPQAGAFAQQAGRETMRPEVRPRALDSILLAQTVAGAGEDAMLYDHHFDGPELNSLGKAKLRLMLEDQQFIADPAVWIVSGDTAQTSAVRRYLADWGLAFEDTRLQAGANPRVLRPAALGLLQQQKLGQGEIQEVEGTTGTSE